MEAFLWQRLTEWETGSCSDGWSHVAHQNGIKSLIQFSVDGLGWVPSLLFHLRPNYGGGDEDNGDLLQKVLCVPCRTQCPRPCSRPPPTRASTRDAWTLTGKSGSVSCGSLLLSPESWCPEGFVCALQESVSPALCNFWWFYGGVNGNLLQESLCHSQACCIQSPCPCGRPLLTHTSAGDTQTFKGRTDSLDGFSGCTQGFV